MVQEYLGREALPDIGEEGSSSSSSPVETLGESIAEEEEEEEGEDEEEMAKTGEGRVGGPDEEEGDRFADLDDGGRETIFDDGEEGEYYAVEIEGL